MVRGQKIIIVIILNVSDRARYLTNKDFYAYRALGEKST